MNWYPKITNLDCKSNISRIFDVYVQRWVNRTYVQISWTHLISEAHFWIRAAPHGVPNSRTNQPSDLIVRSSASTTKHLLHLELSRSLSLPSSIPVCISSHARRLSRAILLMCKSNLCPSAILTNDGSSDILPPCQSIIKTMILGLSPHPKSLEPSVSQCKSIFPVQ